MAHASKFAKPGRVRIAPTVPSQLLNAAFWAPNDNGIVIVLNDRPAAQAFNICCQSKSLTTTLAAEAVGTYIW